MRKFLKNQKGVTMMEVLVTVALLAIVVVPCLSSFIMAQSGNVKAAEVTNAYTEAANLMEELKGIGEVDEVIAQLTPKKDDHEQLLPKEYNDTIYVVYQNAGTYVTVWIFQGSAVNAEYDSENEAQLSNGELLLKGVIAP
ncbi:MAG: prepilin-type N-terminal cleavage/methylation domain-containing protein [Clostridia bacterium]|nr:prepilin-type N-terminal cleavage/methylation domain-containing protein [Clostridia bacterium]